MMKMQKRTVLSLSLLGALSLVVTVPGVRADQAVVVGVNHYPNLPDADLQGCVNDALHMRAALQKSGFQVTLLTEAQATRPGVLQALQSVAGRIKPTERFVFYFAGHGTTGKDKVSHLLLADAQVDSEDNDLSAKDLYDRVADVPAKTRTVFLDSCFSGGMLQSTRGLELGRKNYRSRVFLRPDQRTPEGQSRDLVLVNRRNANQNVAGTTSGTTGSAPVCYFTASRENEQSGEDTIGGQPQGVFTHYLTTQIASKNGSWGDVQKGVGAHVADYTQDQQHPTLSPGFESAPVFGTKGAGGTAAQAQSAAASLWDAYNADHPNPFHVLLTMNPDQTTMHVNDKIAFTVNVGVKGYALILEHGVSGNVNLLFPQSRNAADAIVAPGRVISIPSDPTQAYAPDTPGTERVKVLLFTSKAAAQALLSKMPESLSVPYSQLSSQGSVAKIASGFDTSDITFEVVP